MSSDLHKIATVFEGSDESSMLSLFNSLTATFTDIIQERKNIIDEQKKILRMIKTHAIGIDTEKKVVLDDVDKFRSQILLLAMESEVEVDDEDDGDDSNGMTRSLNQIGGYGEFQSRHKREEAEDDDIGHNYLGYRESEETENNTNTTHET